MKKSLIPFILTLMVGMNACSTDFDVTADWEEITIVYGLLNAEEDVQYLRIQKAFLSENTSALELAQIGDSVYHQTNGEALSVMLEEMKIGSEVADRSIPLSRVSASDEGISKEEGVFATDPYFLYKIDFPLNANRDYRLVINTPSGNVVSSRTSLISDFTVTRPKAEIDVNFQNNYGVFWSQDEHAAVFDIDMYFNYLERRLVDGVEVEEQKRIKWDAISNLIGEDNIAQGNSIRTDLLAENFFNFIANKVEDSPDVIEREVVDLDFVVWAGSEDFLTFNQVALAQFGITSSQAQPTYTNIENGVGLFTSRFRKEINGVPIGGLTIDLIACGDVTGHLRFKRDPNNPNPNCQ